MNWNGAMLILNAALGAASVVVLGLGLLLFESFGWQGPWLFVVAGCYFALLGFVVGVKSPRGLPGACIGVLFAVYVPALFRYEVIGKAVLAFMALGAAGITGVAELLGATLVYRHHLREQVRHR